MLVTVIVDAYSENEIPELAEAIEEIASPSDSYGWSSSGIYSFWDPITKEIYYIGLAVDLPLRFRHHNHLAGCPVECCKWEGIREFFLQRDRLAYSIIVQSTLSQGICSRWEKQNPGAMEYIAEEFGYMDTKEAIEMVNHDVDNSLRFMEGALLKQHLEKYEQLPRWNKIGGLVSSHQSEGLAQLLIPSITASLGVTDPFVARRTIRELASSAEETAFEVHLHGGRLLYAAGVPYEKAFSMIPDPVGYNERIEKTSYLQNFPTL